MVHSYLYSDDVDSLPGNVRYDKRLTKFLLEAAQTSGLIDKLQYSASFSVQQAPDEVITADGSGMYSCNKENHDSIDGGLLFSSGGA